MPEHVEPRHLGERHPQMVTTRGELASVRERMQDEVQRIISDLTNEGAVARARVLPEGWVVGRAGGDVPVPGTPAGLGTDAPVGQRRLGEAGRRPRGGPRRGTRSRRS